MTDEKQPGTAAAAHLGAEAPSSLRRRVAKPVLALVALVVSLAICEGAARLLFPQYQRAVESVLVDDNERIFARSPNTRRRWRHPDRDLEFDIVNNNLGLRHDRNITSKALEKSTVIGMFGDSTTENQNMPAVYGYPEILDALLNLHTDRFEVLNFGVSGYGTDQSYLSWRRWAKDHRADVVVYMLCANDLRNTYETQLFGLDGTEGLVQMPPPEPGGIRRWVGKFYLTYLVLDASSRLGFSSLSTQVRRRFGTQGQMRAAVVARRETEIAAKFLELRGKWSAAADLSHPEMRTAFEVQRRLIARWRKEVEALGAKFIVAYYPRQQEQNLGEMLHDGETRIDLYARFKERFGPDYSWKDASFINDGHGNEMANQAIALELYPVLANALDLETLEDARIARELGIYYSALGSYYRPSRWVTWPDGDPAQAATYRRRYQPLSGGP